MGHPEESQPSPPRPSPPPTRRSPLVVTSWTRLTSRKKTRMTRSPLTASLKEGRRGGCRYSHGGHRAPTEIELRNLLLTARPKILQARDAPANTGVSAPQGQNGNAGYGPRPGEGKNLLESYNAKGGRFARLINQHFSPDQIDDSSVRSSGLVRRADRVSPRWSCSLDPNFLRPS